MLGLRFPGVMALDSFAEPTEREHNDALALQITSPDFLTVFLWHFSENCGHLGSS